MKCRILSVEGFAIFCDGYLLNGNKDFNSFVFLHTKLIWPLNDMRTCIYNSNCGLVICIFGEKQFANTCTCFKVNECAILLYIVVVFVFCNTSSC